MAVDPARKDAVSPNGLPSFLTVEEVAAVLRCQPEKIYRLAARGVLPSYKIEGRRLFDPVDVSAFLSACREGPTLLETGGGRDGIDTELPNLEGGAALRSPLPRLPGRERSKAFSARKDAQSFKLDVERKHQAGILYQAPPERFGAVAKAWLERYERGAAGNVRPRPRSIALVHENLAVLAPLSELSLERIHGPVVEDLIVAIAEKAPRRAEMALALLKRILRAAEERGQVVDPAVYRVRIAKHEEREPCFLAWEEAEELRAWLPEYVCRVIPVTILTMLRRGEVLGLRDRDIDFETGSIAVFSQHQDGERVRTKTRAGRRTVDVGPAVLKLLREQQLARAPNDEGLLFPTASGAPFDPNNFMSRLFKPATAAAGFPELTFHDLRHTGASLMIAAGCHVKVIAEQMGHSDGGVLVLRRYGHLYKGARRHAAIALRSHVFEGTKDSPAGTVWDGAQQAWEIE